VIDGDGQARATIFNMFFYLSEQCLTPPQAGEFCEHGVNRGFAPVFAFFDYFLFKQKKVIGIGEENK